MALAVFEFVLIRKQAPLVSLFAAASIGSFALAPWLVCDGGSIIIPFLFLSVIGANGFGCCMRISVNK